MKAEDKPFIKQFFFIFILINQTAPGTIYCDKLGNMIICTNIVSDPCHRFDQAK